MKMRPVFLVLLGFIAGVSPSGSQNRAASYVQPHKLEVMRNLELESDKSDFPVALPREWGRLVSIQKLDATDYSLFLENDAGEIYVVNLIQRGRYFYLNTYDNGGTALVIKRGS